MAVDLYGGRNGATGGLGVDLTWGLRSCYCMHELSFRSSVEIGVMLMHTISVE